MSALADVPPAEFPSPFFSIVTPVYNPPLTALADMIASVQAQTFSNWELICVDDYSPNPQVLTLLQEAAARDSRIKVIAREANGHIVKASNDGIKAAHGEFIALLDHDDLLTPDALAEMAQVIAVDPQVDYLYSDDDKVSEDYQFYNEFRKSDWAPERMRGQNLTSHFSVIRTKLVQQLGGFREGFEGSQDYDLFLRVTEKARKVVHIPKILYHWKAVVGSAALDDQAKPYAYDAALKALDEHLHRVGISGHAEHINLREWPGTYRIVRDPIPADVLVSVVIPTKGVAGYVWGEDRVFVVTAVRSLLEHGGHPNLEIIIVYDSSTPDSVLAELVSICPPGVLKLIEYAETFNFSRKCNIGVLAACGEVVLLLNDDIEITGRRFISNLIAPLLEPVPPGTAVVGVTGARLLYPDSTIQHAGIEVNDGAYFHSLMHELDEEPGLWGSLLINREVTAVTGACLAIKRELYLQLGGLSENLPNNYNDIDLCLKAWRAGYRVVWLADARAYHFESQSRQNLVHDWELEFLNNRWWQPPQDPYMPPTHERRERHQQLFDFAALSANN